MTDRFKFPPVFPPVMVWIIHVCCYLPVMGMNMVVNGFKFPPVFPPVMVWIIHFPPVFPPVMVWIIHVFCLSK